MLAADLAPALSAREMAREVLETEILGLQLMADQLSDAFSDAVDRIRSARGRLVVCGMGKSGHIGRKIAATFASTGTPAQFVHPAEASHGDLGMITEQDVCLVLSTSGETAELADVIAHTRRFSIPMIGITRDPGSTLARQSDIALILPDVPEACSIGMAPTTSTTCALALGDALAVTLMRLRDFRKDNFLVLHPGGKLGAQLLTVSALMHTGEKLPVVDPYAPMGDALVEMTRKGFGSVAVVEDRELVGVITDGDLRRNMNGLMEKTAGQVCTRPPQAIGPDRLASEALGIMNGTQISTLCVVDANRRLCGLLHIHDCLRAGIK